MYVFFENNFKNRIEGEILELVDLHFLFSRYFVYIYLIFNIYSKVLVHDLA